MSAADHQDLATSLESDFGSRFIVPPAGDTFPTLDSIWRENRQIVLLYSDHSNGGSVLTDHRSFWPRSKIRSEWADTRDINRLKDHLKGEILKAPQSQLFVLQGVLTPDAETIANGEVARRLPAGIIDFLKASPNAPRSLGELAEKNNATISNWFTVDWKDSDINILMIDWIKNSDFARQIILLNLERSR